MQELREKQYFFELEMLADGKGGNDEVFIAPAVVLIDAGKNINPL
jgi:hypothetical protein